MTKLFSNISLLAQNSDLIKRNTKKYRDAKNLNIPAVYKTERKINSYLNNSKYSLIHTMDENDLIRSYMGVH